MVRDRGIELKALLVLIFHGGLLLDPPLSPLLRQDLRRSSPLPRCRPVILFCPSPPSSPFPLFRSVFCACSSICSDSNRDLGERLPRDGGRDGEEVPLFLSFYYCFWTFIIVSYAGEIDGRHVHGKSILVVTNTTIAPLYLDKVVRALTHRNPKVTVESVILPDGEKYKNMETLMKVFDKAIECRMDRRCTFVALGGGVIGDMCGFAAAAFLRGVNFIQIPTTLMAQVDSSVGGKTGVNHPLGKNLIGAFYQPQCVLIDTDTLNTLPDRELASGIGEAVKYGLIRDKEFFEWQEKNMQALLAR
ncbi:hypothetical protein BHM03_00056551 [Ensete ventricosum]|nr:hypothetical protein BHM03_00056551 [Ensete ventricosum]